MTKLRFLPLLLGLNSKLLSDSQSFLISSSRPGFQLVASSLGTIWACKVFLGLGATGVFSGWVAGQGSSDVVHRTGLSPTADAGAARTR